MTATLHDGRPGVPRRLAATALGVMVVLFVGVIGVVGLGSGTVGAQGLPLCGGNQTIRPAPRTCFNTKLIDGTEITVVLDVTASGVATATYTLGTPRPVDTPIRMRWHEGISSGPLVDEISGVIPAGSLGPVTLQVRATQTCGGQIDTKAVFTGNGDARGRVAAPYVGLDICNQPTTTAATTTTATTTTTASSTTSGSSTTTSVTTVPDSSTSPTTAGASVAQSSVPGSLPSTGGERTRVALVALAALVAGAGILVASRRGRDEQPV
jgi:LPXTG-motif cell wall-anchored protein